MMVSASLRESNQKNVKRSFVQYRTDIPHPNIRRTASKRDASNGPEHPQGSGGIVHPDLAPRLCAEKDQGERRVPREIHKPMLEAGVKRSGRTIADRDATVPFGCIGKSEEVPALVAFVVSDVAEFMCASLGEITGARAVV